MAKTPYTREEQAAKELGHTEFSRGVALFLCAVFTTLIFAVPIIQLFWEWSSEERCDFAQVVPTFFEVGFFFDADQMPSSLNALTHWSEGERLGPWDRFRAVNARVLRGIGQLEDCMHEKSVLTHHLLPATQRALTGVLGVGNEKAYLGQDGWLFFRTGLDYLMGQPFLEPAVLEARRRGGSEFAAPPEPDPIAAIVELRDRMARRGIELVVLPTPVKGSIYPDKFSQRYEGGPRGIENPSYEFFKRELEKHGVHLFDAHRHLSAARLEGAGPLYLRRDTHWSPLGMEKVASGLVDFIEERGLLTLPTPGEGYDTKSVVVQNTGDIERMLRLSDDAGLYQPQQVEIHPVLGPAGALFESSRDSHVLLLGDSFSNIYSLGGMGWGEHAGLAAHLSAQLKRPIDVISQNDAGSHATRVRLDNQLRRGDDRLRGKELVIYQFVERELAVGDWKTGLKYELGDAPTRAEQPARDSKPRRVKGRVKEVVHCPPPAEVVYKDCYFPLALGNLEYDGPRDLPAEMVVQVWGLLDGRATAHQKVKTGDTVELSIVAFEQVEERYASYNHMAFEGALAHLPSYWGDPRSPGGQGRTFPSKAPAADPSQPFVVAGTDGFLFLNSELRHLRAGVFWGPAAKDTSRAANAAHKDPLPAILDFKQQLDRLGVSLLVVPVPAKALVYRDKLGEAGDELTHQNHQRFFDLLRTEGVEVLDLVEPFEAARGEDAGAPIYCRQDSHWSGRGCQLAAELIARKIQQRDWYPSVPKREYEQSSTTIEMAGDLRSRYTRDDLPEESIEIVQVFERAEGGNIPVTSWRQSPVVLLGDSHTLVFGAGGDMHAAHGGLADHLASHLKFPVDLMGVRGSGATPARVRLSRRGDNLQGKKIIVWVFAVREFSESRTGWAQVPLTR